MPETPDQFQRRLNRWAHYANIGTIQLAIAKLNVIVQSHTATSAAKTKAREIIPQLESLTVLLKPQLDWPKKKEKVS